MNLRQNSRPNRGRRSRVRKPIASLALATVSAFSVVLPAWSAPGDLDASFGTAGIVRTNPSDPGPFPDSDANAVVIQADGKIVAAGLATDFSDLDAFGLARYLDDGSLDLSFAGDGTVLTQVGDPAALFQSSEVQGIAIQSDGKLVAAGRATVLTGGASNAGFALARYNTDGSLDATFDLDGILRLQIGLPSGGPSASSGANGIAIQDDGKIVAVGNASDANGDGEFALVRFNADGSLDASFDGDGIVRTQPSDSAAQMPRASAIALAIQADGKIVAAGEADDANGNSVIALVRYNPDGSLDTAFGSNGIVRTQASDPAAASQRSLARAVKIQGDGKVVVAGIAVDATNQTAFAVARYDSLGSLDGSFDGDGIALTQAADPAPMFPSSSAQGLSIQANGKIVVGGGATGASGSGVFALVRYNTDGSVDTSFGVNGIVRTDTSDPAAVFPTSGLLGLVIQADGKIIGAGEARDANDDDNFALARYEGDDSSGDTCDGQAPTNGCRVNGVPNQPCLGTNGDDKIIGTSGDDVIVGLDGNDRLFGRKGNDLICGDDGHDRVWGGFGRDVLHGNAGNDKLFGLPNDDFLDGGTGIDFLDGGFGRDTCINGEFVIFCH